MGVYSNAKRATGLDYAEMITPLSVGARRGDLRTQTWIHQRELHRRLTRIQRKACRAFRARREDAIVLYLSARRFPAKSNEALILRLLAQTAVRRMKKLETVLKYLSDIDRPHPRGWLFVWRCFYASHAPRYWLLLWLRHH